MKSHQRRLAANIPKLYAVRFLFWMHFFASVLVPFFRDWGGISYQQIFLLNAWFMLWNFVLEVPTGTVADFFGRRVSLAAGALVSAIASLVYASTPHFGIFLLGEILFAVAFTLMSGADEALAYDTLKAIGAEASAKSVLARLESFKLAGLVSAGFSGSLIANHFGLRAPMLLQAVPSAACFVIAATLREAPGGIAVDGRSAYGDVLRSGFRFFRSHAALRALTADMVGVGALTWMIIWLYQPSLERAGITLAWFGVVHAALSLGQIAVLSRVEMLERLLGSKRAYLQMSALAPAACFIALGVSHSALITVPAIVAAAAFGLTRGPVFSSYMNKHIPSQQRATVLSVISMVRTLATAVMNLIIGTLADYSLPLALICIGVAIVLVTLRLSVEEAHL